MKTTFLNLLNQLEKDYLPHDETLREFVERLQKNPKLFKKEGVMDHFCTFFVPIDFKKKRIYMGHHIKADDWIPPGGHMEPGEVPEDTTRREFTEELGYHLKNEKIELVDISITLIDDPQRPCTAHFDFWCLVHIDERHFDFDRGEFHEAQWFSFDEALKKTERPHIRAVMEKFMRT